MVSRKQEHMWWMGPCHGKIKGKQTILTTMEDRKLPKLKRWIVRPETKKIEWCASMALLYLKCRNVAPKVV
jgi:hypothetical protein